MVERIGPSLVLVALGGTVCSGMGDHHSFSTFHLQGNDFDDDLAYFAVPADPSEQIQDPESFLELSSGRKIPMQQKFDIKCMCAKDFNVPESCKLPVDIPVGKCAASEVKIRQEEDGVGMTLEGVRGHIGNPLKIQWAKVPKHHFSSIEGRTSHPILGTPGGDLGEWVLAMAIYEGMSNKELTFADVHRLFKEFLKLTGKMSFYYHTDRANTEKLGRILTIERLDLTDTPKNDDVATNLLRELSLPTNIGSEHFRLLMENAHKFNVRKQLTIHVIHAFFRTLWAKTESPPVWQKLRLVTVDGRSGEKAFIKIKVAPECVANQVAPLIQPKTPETSVYVAHRQAVEAFRKEISDFFADQDSTIDAEKFKENTNELGDRHLEKDIEYLARTNEKRIPVFEVELL